MTTATRPSKLEQARSRAADAEAAAASTVGPATAAVEAAQAEVSRLEAIEADEAGQRRRKRLEAYVKGFDAQQLAQRSMDASAAFRAAVLEERGADVLPAFLAWQRARVAGYVEAEHWRAVRAELGLVEMNVSAPTSPAALDFARELEIAVGDLVTRLVNGVAAELQAALDDEAA